VRDTNLFGEGVLDSGDETGDLVAHGLGRDAGGGGLEVDVTGAANALAVGRGFWHERHWGQKTDWAA